MKGRKHHGDKAGHHHDIHGGHPHHEHAGGATMAALKHKGKYAKGGAVKGVASVPSMAKRKRGGKVTGELDTRKMAGDEGSPMKPLSGADVKKLAVEKNDIPAVDEGGKGGMKRARGGRMHEKKEHEHHPH